MKSQLNILLAGYGDIARRLVAQSGLECDRITAVRRSETNESSVLRQVRGDLSEPAFVAELFNSGFDVVVATITPDSFSDEGYRDSYVAVANSFAQSMNAAKHLPGLLIWVSSTSVFGEGDGEWVNEKTPALPRSFSGKRLLEAESVIQQLPVKTVVVRFSGIYGPGRNRTIDTVCQGKIAAQKGSPWTNRIHSEDCAGVLAHLINCYRQGAILEGLYIATDSKPVPLYEVHSWLAGQLGVADPEESASGGRANRRCSNQRLLASGYRFRYPDYRSGYAELIAGLKSVK